MAEFERDIIRERTQAGLAAAHARGRKGGRPKVMDAKKIALAKQLHSNKTHRIEEISRLLQVSKSTLYAGIKIKDLG